MKGGEHAGWLERAGDRVNPILVKEVRQALRGRYFRLSFWCTVLAASVGSLAFLVSNAEQASGEMGDTLGARLYAIVFACLAIATHGLVPFAAFVSMGAEWDEHTFDLLVLSNLSPRQIVLGKVLSAIVQSLLFYSAFGPFLVFAFLLRGVDPWALFLTLAGSVVLSVSLSCLAVAFSCATRQRFLRIGQMGLLAAFLILGATTPSITFAAYLVRYPQQLHVEGALTIVGSALGLMLAFAGYFVLAGSARLAHPEENRSSALRIYAIGMALAFLVTAGVLGLTSYSMPGEVFVAFALAAQIYLAIVGLFFVTEPDRLGRRVRTQVPRRLAAARFATPFLPGGGRGMLWYLVANGAVGAWLALVVLVGSWSDPAFVPPSSTQWMVAPVALAFGVVYLGLPSLVFARHTEEPRVRFGAGVTCVFLFVASVVLPAVVGFFLDRHTWMDFQHRGNPAYVLICLLTHNENGVAYAPEAVLAIALVVLALSWKRSARSVHEVEQASRGRRVAPPAPASLPLEESSAL